METKVSSQTSSALSRNAHEEESKKFQDMFLELVSELPRERGWMADSIYLYEGFWYYAQYLYCLIALQQNFKAQPNDVLLVSFPKSGTTWLKALLFSIVNRKLEDDHHHLQPLLEASPHELVPFLEAYAKKDPMNPRPESSLMSTHTAYSSLPKSVLRSASRIVYVVRDPKDVLVSCWHFVNKIRAKTLPPISLAEAFDQFSRGVSPYGPYWDHVLGYWKASIESPERVFFLRYEELKAEPCSCVKRLAEFLGHPFSMEEEKGGVVNRIVQLCSFENLSNLEVNKVGSHSTALYKIDNHVFFREGKVGDSMNHLSPEMIQNLDQITEEKFKEFGLSPFYSS